MIRKTTLALLVVLSALTLTGCLSETVKLTLPETLRPPIEAKQTPHIEQAKEKAAAAATTRFSKTPSVPTGPHTAGINKDQTPKLQGKNISINIENLPIPAFINEVFGNILGLSFEISPNMEKLTDLVTLRFTEPQPPETVYQTAINILADYGVRTKQENDLHRFSYSTKVTAGKPPLLISGRTLPNVPISHRPIFQLVTLHSVRNTEVRSWLNQLYKQHGLIIGEDSKRNAIILQGSPELVNQAVQAINVLDQPTMRGKHSIKITPIFKNAKTLGDELLKILEAEGYGASNSATMGSIIVLPLESSNTLFIFAADQTRLEHVKQWAATLDQASINAKEQQLFYYKVQNVDAKGIVDALGTLTSSIITDLTNKQSKLKTKQLNSNQARLQVDTARNSIMFFGASKQWSKLIPIIKQMDIAARQVLIEVTVAEVTLTEDEQFGFEWLTNNSAGSRTSSLSTLGGLGVPASGGLSYILQSAGQTRMVLNALAANQKVNILSTPRIMVKSGEQAKIEVGTDIPIVTSQASASDLTGTGSPSILQNIQYRKTGVLLNVEPIVYAGRQVDIKITQEISAAQNNNTSGVDSPTILTRKVETSLSLHDGNSVLLGGLISTDLSQEKRGIPYLMDIPYLGKLFSNNSQTKVRSEILILVTPYVIDNADEILSITHSSMKTTGFK